MKFYEKEFNELNKSGFIHLKDCFKIDDVIIVREIIDDLFLEYSKLPNKCKKTFPKTGASSSNVCEINHACSLAKKLKLSNVYFTAKKIAAQLLKKNMFYSFDHAIYKLPHSGSIRWHQDQIYKSRVKTMKSIHFWIPLHDIDEQRGGMQYLSGSNNELPYQHISNSELEEKYVSEQYIDKTKIIKCNSKVGDIIAHFPNTLHSSLPNTSNVIRKAWILHFSPYGRFEPLLPENLFYYSKSRIKSIFN